MRWEESGEAATLTWINNNFKQHTKDLKYNKRIMRFWGRDVYVYRL